MKTLNYFDDEQDTFMNEIKLLKMIDHPSVVKFYGEFLYSNNLICVLMELCEVTK